MLGVVAVAAPTGWLGPATAGCAAPTLRIEGSPRDEDPAGRVAVDPGAGLVVEGRGFRDGCNDTGVVTTSVLGCEEHVADPPGPAADVGLSLVQDGRSWTLGRTDADETFGATWRVQLPTEVRPGAARLVADGSEPLRLRVASRAETSGDRDG